MLRKALEAVLSVVVGWLMIWTWWALLTAWGF